MQIHLIKANLNDAILIHKMQVKSFMPLLQKYKDYDTSPASETVEHIVNRLNQPFTDYYLIKSSQVFVGAIRIVKKGNGSYRISPVFIVPEYQGQGIAQVVFKMVEDHYRDAILWELDTILEEQGTCYLYEKLGYKRTGKLSEINDKMTIVYYEKQLG